MMDLVEVVVGREDVVSTVQQRDVVVVSIFWARVDRSPFSTVARLRCAVGASKKAGRKGRESNK
jgi:hypothetical protein